MDAPRHPSTPLRVLALLFSSATLVPLLVLAGATLCFIALCIDYYAFDPGRTLGWKQWLGLSAGAAAILAGAAIDVIARRRTLLETAAFWGVAAQVGALILLVNAYDIETNVFQEVVGPLMLFGFIANHYLPPALRPAFFVLLGVGAIVAVIGAANLVAALWLIVLALGLIGLCHAPAPFAARVVLVLAAAGVLALMHARVFETDWSGLAVPLLASMFMFRLIVYLHDVHAKKGPTGLWARLGYFFMPPNPVFPFFPVVDYTTYGRTYYDQEATRIYQRGAVWILRGVIHLLIYRLVYFYLTLSPDSVTNPGQFLHYIGANFGLYFRVSGLFHLIVGFLLLFGFNLPETHSRFYFSHSFIEFWRRINIYWKDFMQKLFFNPAFTWLKRRGLSHQTSVLGAIGVVFVSTWLFHTYQWFWLRGAAHFTAPDALFWLVLGLLLAVQTALEGRRQPAARGPDAKARTYLLGPMALRALRTLCTMFIICLLWSMWTSHTMLAWFDLLAASGVAPALSDMARASAADWGVTALSGAIVVVAASVACGVTFGLAPAHEPARLRKPAPKKAGGWAARAAPIAAPFAALICLWIVQTPAVRERLDATVAVHIDNLRTAKLNAADDELRTRGYYEDLTNIDRASPELWAAMQARPNNLSPIHEMPSVRQLPDYLGHEFIPQTSSVFTNVSYDINSWGMRDDETTLAKPPGTVRIAFIGASRTAGWGVEHEDTFVQRLERKLNALSERAGGPRIEILNFAVDGYHILQQAIALERKVWRFSPDVIVFSGSHWDISMRMVANRYVRGIEPPYPFIHSVLDRANVNPSLSEERVEARLTPFAHEVAAEVYRLVAAQAAQHRATPLWMYVPSLDEDMADPRNRVRFEASREDAEQAGLIALRTHDVYAGHDIEDIHQGPWDGAHPNPAGHELFAERLMQELVALDREGEIDLGLVR